ncbi:MAG: hypothetical protein ACI9WV_001143 [Patiriisocius sp.]|jgi:hypothetical protein
MHLIKKTIFKAMSNHRYTLEPYNGMKTRYKCPNCDKAGQFTRYIDTQTNEHLNDAVGVCSRLIKCGYHYKPKQYFQDNNIAFDKTKLIPFIRRTPPPKPIASFINAEVMQESLTSKKSNLFIDFLTNIWDEEIANYLKVKYNIGTSNYWKGATTFWMQDIKGNIRSGKIMLYNSVNGKRVKKPYNHINWEHKTRKLENFNLEQCYFGEHLINTDRNKPIAICESEKTAIISSIYLPEFIWLACGSLNNLNESKTKALKGRNVVLFPDLKCFDLWNDKIPKLTKLATFRTSTLLEEKATAEEKEKGLDIADYLLKT